MSDNTILNTGSGGDTIGSDDIGGVKYQRVKIVLGADGVNDGDVSSSNKLPIDIDQPLTDAELRATPIDVNASIDTTGLATSAKQDTGNTSLASIDGKLTNPLPVSGTVTANTGLSQPLTNTELRAVAVPISGTVTANTGLTQPLTDTQLRLTPVPVSGTVTVNALPTGTNNIGDVDVLTLPALPTGTNNIGDVDVLTIAAGDNNIGNVDIVSMPNVVVSTLPALVTGSAIVGRVGIDQTTPGTTNKVNIGTDGTVAIGTALPAGTAAIGKLAANSGVIIGDVNVVAVPTLTKSTQGATGFSVQQLNNAGRVALRFYAVAAAAGTTTTETAITLTKSADNGATSTGTSFVITSAKIFRITQLVFATRGHSTATIQTTTFNLRINTAGAVITSSTPIILAARVATPATASAWDRFIVDVADGIEILGNGTIQFGITAAATYTTNAPTWDVIILGYEY